MFSTMNMLTIAITALLGGWLALHDHVQVGVIATFIVYIRNFFNPMRAIAMLYNQLQSALAGAERIFGVLDVQAFSRRCAGALPLPRSQGAVKFDHVSFAYKPGNPVLIDVSLEAKPGQTIALVGPTGAGKTTIVNLLSRFYDVTEGAITDRWPRYSHRAAGVDPPAVGDRAARHVSVLWHSDGKHPLRAAGRDRRRR